MRRHILAAAIITSIAIPASAAGPLPAPSIHAFPDADGPGGSRSSLPYFAGFEASEGFSAGWINNQPAGAPSADQWRTHASSTDQGIVSTTNPCTGTQHLELGPDSGVTGSGAWSPQLGVPAANQYVFDVDVNVGSADGADYDIIGQSVSEGEIAFRAKHFYNDYDGDSYLGDVLVVDNDGSGLEWVDSGFDYPAGSYYHLRVTIDFLSGSTQYDFWTDADSFYADAPADWDFTAAAPILGATRIEQAVFLCDGHNEGEVGSFDNLQIAIPEPTTLALLGIAAAAFIRRRSWSGVLNKPPCAPDRSHRSPA